MKLILAVPTYGPTDSQANRHLRAALMHASRHGVEWVGDMSPERLPFDATRNLIVKSVLEHKGEDRPDAIMWVDSDVLLPIDGITRLAREQKDFITGIYFQRAKPHWPLVSVFNTERQSFSFLTKWPENVIAPIDGCGFGCVLTSLKMLEALPEPWFKYEKFSEDFDFCLRAASRGFQLHVHTGVLCGHLKEPEAATIKDFHAIRDSGELEKYVVKPANSAA